MVYCKNIIVINKKEHSMSLSLIPRKTFFGNPDHLMVRISPDGRYLSWLAPRDGVLNLWVAETKTPEKARPVTRDTGRGIRFYLWAKTGRHLLYIQDAKGDEDWHIHSVDFSAETDRDLTPFQKTQARIYAGSDRFPTEIIAGLNNRNPRYHDLYRINLETGASSLVLQHDRFGEFTFDENLALREAFEMKPDGSRDILYPDSRGGFQKMDSIPLEDNLTTGSIVFNKDGHTLYMADSRGRDTAALTAVNHESRAVTVLAEDPRADLADCFVHPRDHHICAAAFTYDRKRWQVLDPAIQEDLDYLHTVASGDLEVLNATDDFGTWVVAFLPDAGPVRYYLYDRKKRHAIFLFNNRAELENKPLVEMRPAVVQARDGLGLVCYYSLPVGSDANGDGIPDKPLPLVFLPHGGPWARDHWGYDPIHQWLANRGYAVLSVNFRASSGFGKAFLNAGDREWGGKIMDDQIDAVRWTIDTKIADPAKIAVMGGSFGGYSALAQLTLNPETFACGVDIVGPSNLITLIESMPEYWKPDLELFTTRVGDHRTAEGRALLKKHSPLTYADRIVRPLLIGQGANDPRVKEAESDQIVKAMQAKNIPVTYVLYPDEGHGFARPENRLAFFAIAEAFLAKNLGGRCQPVGDDFNGSSHTIVCDSGD
jgi:dipeptidyl aminopeptidase/acylaminoacyl peptidase